MEATPLHYERWVEEAMRSVVRRALTHVAKHGLPGDHHFYLTVKMDEAGVDVPDALRAQYPDEMTIVLQNQFWNLAVFDEAFEVTLSFGGARSKLRVPFNALTAFADPGVNFGLQLKPFDSEGGDRQQSGTGTDDSRASLPGPADAPAQGKRKPSEESDTGGEVIALDAFRKK